MSAREQASASMVHEDSAALREIRNAAEKLCNERPYGDLSEPLAAWLTSEASRWHITNANLYEPATGAFSGFCSCGNSVNRPDRDVPAQCGRLSRALAVARVISGGES